jgi:hypothetical protein
MFQGREYIRQVHMAPYLEGKGPTFTLYLYEASHAAYAAAARRRQSQTPVGYRLTMREPGASKSVVIFDAEDYGCSPCHAIDSDASVRGLLGFLTLRPGDDADGFTDAYTDVQRAFAEAHAETLSCWVLDRFGED